MVFRPVFNIMYKQKKQVKKCIWALYQEVVLFLLKINSFYTYHRMISKGESWDGPCKYGPISFGCFTGVKEEMCDK